MAWPLVFGIITCCLLFICRRPVTGIEIGAAPWAWNSHSQGDCWNEHYFRSALHVGGEVRDLNLSRLVPVDPFHREPA